MTIEEVKNFPKSLLKKKTLPLYKAFIINDEEEEMKINTNIDVLALTKEAAMDTLVNSKDFDKIIFEIFGVSDKSLLDLDINNLYFDKVISFAIIKLDLEDLKKKDLVDNGDVYFENDQISITLKDKLYKVDVEDSRLSELKLEVDPKTEKVIITKIEFENKNK